MPINTDLKYIHEPTDLQCGQAVLAMLTGVSTAEICRLLNNEKETTLKEMLAVFDDFNIKYSKERKEVFKKSELPEIALLSLETPRCWHWSLFANGRFFDPEHGVLDDFPISKRKYYWEILKD